MPAIAIWGIVLGAIALVIAFILSIRVKVIVSFKDGKLLAHKKILFLKKQVYPKLKKKKKRHQLRYSNLKTHSSPFHICAKTKR